MIILNNYNVGRKMLIGSITTLLSWMYKVGEWVVGGCNTDTF